MMQTVLDTARPDCFERNTTVFLDWFRSLPGATFSDAVEIADLRYRGAGRGIIANRDIPAETTIFAVPRHAILSVETSELSQKLPYLFDSHGDEDHEQCLDSWSGLIMVMMYEFFLGEQSTWKPYLDILPRAFETPMFWTNEELTWLQASALVHKIGKQSADEMFRNHLLPAIRKFPNVFESSDQYSDGDLLALAHRMGSTIMAYAFDLEGDGAEEDTEQDGWLEDREGKSMMGMVAMADILNADAEFNVHVNHCDEALAVTTLRDIGAGEEILNYYGPLPNSELLRRYGYVTDRHSRYDVVEVPWNVLQDSLISDLSVTHEAVTRAMEDFGAEDFEDCFMLERESDGPNSEGTLTGNATIRDVPSDLKEQLKTVLKILQKEDNVEIMDKRKRSDIIQRITAKTLQSIACLYATTAHQDEQLVKQGQLSHRQKMAVTVRLGEKRLIQEALDLLSGTAAQEDSVSPTVKKTKRVGRDQH